MPKRGKRITSTDALVSDLRELGYATPLTKNSHYRVTHPDKAGLVFIGSTPSDHRSLMNTLRDLRREFSYEPPDKRQTC